MMLVCIVLRIRDIDVAWLSRFLRFSAEGFDSSGGVTVLSHLIREKKYYYFMLIEYFGYKRRFRF